MFMKAQILLLVKTIKGNFWFQYRTIVSSAIVLVSVDNINYEYLKGW